MDEQQLAELFRAAAARAEAEAPPAAFDHADVLAGSRRIARRQRVTVAVAVAAVAAIGVGALLTGGLGRSGQTSTLAEPPTSSAVPVDAPAEGMQAGDAAGGQAPVPDLAPAPDAAGPSARSKALAAPGDGCAEPDARVFTELTAVLPAGRGANPHPIPGGCAPGGTGVAVDVADDSGGRGTLVVVLTPSGADPHPSDTRTRVSATAHLRSGGELRVTASSAGGPVPYRDRLDQLIRSLAARL